MKPNNIADEPWNDYHWQLNNVVNSSRKIKEMFPDIAEEKLALIRLYEKHYRFQLTPYLLNCLDLNNVGESRHQGNLATLFFPDPELLLKGGTASYNPNLMNWEMPEELTVQGSSAFHWKYTDRLLYRATGCMSICSYCFEAHRVIDRGARKVPQDNDWQRGMEFLREHGEIREFVFSGGDPLLAPDELLERRIADVRSIPHIETIRFNSAVLMHCPMRVTDGLIRIFKRYGVTELGVHIIHPSQMTEEFESALERFDSEGYGSIIKLAQIPLLRGINDDTQTMKELLCGLEKHRIKGYYLLHGMPWTLGAVRFRTKVYRGVEVLKPLYRSLSHVAWPEYIIVGRGGKATVPLECNGFWIDRRQLQEPVWTTDGTEKVLEHFALEQKGEMFKFFGTPEFFYSKHGGNPVVVFKNWKGRWEMYLDSDN
jgi:lysine 2,3-aminomutase